MSKFKSLSIVLLVAVVAVFAYFEFVRGTPGKLHREGAPTASVASASAADADAALPPERQEIGETGWAPASGASSPTTPTSGVAVPDAARRDSVAKTDTAAEARRQAIGQVLQRIQSMSEASRRDPATFAKQVEALKQANGGPIIGNIDLDILKNNLMIAAKMQSLASDIKATASVSTGAASSRVQGDVQQKIQEMRTLTDQIRSSVVVSTGQ
ncbi:hypothetical protein [Burkholderia gladioli]|uniref:hypothetical protein n=1 Tax=Burkholderia gladioli TaxID=28095 RepID=UPI0016410568|nr:hypothetical protein [Burkholderia gladioli]